MKGCNLILHHFSFRKYLSSHRQLSITIQSDMQSNIFPAEGEEKKEKQIDLCIGLLSGPGWFNWLVLVWWRINCLHTLLVKLFLLVVSVISPVFALDHICWSKRALILSEFIIFLFACLFFQRHFYFEINTFQDCIKKRNVLISQVSVV